MSQPDYMYTIQVSKNCIEREHYAITITSAKQT